MMPDRETKERIVKMRYGMEVGYGQEIVRCRDCEHGEECVKPHKDYWCHLHDFYQNGDWFCADGKRKEVGEVG
jgi:hypothetical protein